MKITITPKNTAKINAVLLAINGKSTAHTYDSYRAVECLVEEAEARLDMLRLPKKNRTGVGVDALSGSAVAGRYRYLRNATFIQLVRGVKNWMLVQAKSQDVDVSGGYMLLRITPEQCTIAVEKMMLSVKAYVQPIR